MQTPGTVHEGDFVLVMPGIEFVEDNIKEARIGPFFELEIKAEFVTDLPNAFVQLLCSEEHDMGYPHS
jgi:hypothetical protein